MTATSSRDCSAPEPGARGATQPGAALALVGVRQRVDETARVALRDGRRGRLQDRLRGPVHRGGPDVGDHRVALVRPQPHAGAVQRREGRGDRPVGRVGGLEPCCPGASSKLSEAGVRSAAHGPSTAAYAPTVAGTSRTHCSTKAAGIAGGVGTAYCCAVEAPRASRHGCVGSAPAAWASSSSSQRQASRGVAAPGAETRSQGSRSPISDATRAGRRIHGPHFSELPGNAPPVVAEKPQWALS